MMMFYKLESRIPVKCASGREWADWFESAGEALIVAQDEVDIAFVLTVFTGIDQGGSADPQLFETLTFVRGKSTGIAIRSATWEQAEQAHQLRAKAAIMDALDATPVPAGLENLRWGTPGGDLDDDFDPNLPISEK